MTITGPGTRIDQGIGNEYLNYTDVMGSQGGVQPTDAKASQFNTYAKSKLHWLPDANTTQVTGRVNATYRLYAMDDPNAAPLTNPQDPSSPRAFDTGKRYAVRVPKQFGSDPVTEYWLEYRQHAGWANNPWVRDGIEVVLAPSARTNASTQRQYSTLIDTTPETSNRDMTMIDAPLVVGKTYTDESEGVSITPLAEGTDDPDHPESLSGKWIDVRVNFFNGADQAPVLTSTTPAADTIERSTGQPLQLSTTATDADGDALAYHWQFEDETPFAFFHVYSTFGTNVSSATKQWSTPGDYKARLVVSDMKGMVASRSWLVRVTDVSHPAVSNRIGGRVIDALGTPVQGVLVSAGAKRALTDTDGTYHISLPADAPSATVTASKPGWLFTAPGFVDPTSAMVFPGPDTVGVDFRGTADTYRINGAVADFVAGTNGKGALVRELRVGGIEPAGDYGNYELRVANGYNVVQMLDGNGNPFSSVEVRIEYGSVLGVDFDTWSSTMSGAGRPAVAVAAAAEPVTGGRVATVLSVTGTDPDGPADGLIYTWSQVSGPTVTLPAGSHAGRRIEVPFTQSGTYRFRVVIKDTGGYTYGDQPGDTGNEVTVTVGQVASYLRVTPDGDHFLIGTTKQYTAQPFDQWGQPMTGSVTWLPPVRVGDQSAGTVSTSGLFTAPSDPGRISVKASLPGGAVASATAGVHVQATIANRWTVYGRAQANMGFLDLRADKDALLPGQGAATFRNYTSYDRGINCILIEMPHAWGDITAADFVFRTGNTSDPSTWVAAPPPDAVTLYAAAGGYGELVAITWPDYKMYTPDPSTQAVANAWLKITVLANSHTGLASPDVFYFGNLIGDTGINNTGAYATLAEDWSATRSAVNGTHPAYIPLTDFYDHNRDGVYTSVDYQIVHDNFFASLYLISV
jgi:hypothetical protein